MEVESRGYARNKNSDGLQVSLETEEIKTVIFIKARNRNENEKNRNEIVHR